MKTYEDPPGARLGSEALTWLLALAVVGVVTAVYLPSREQSLVLESRLQAARNRVLELRMRIDRLRLSREAMTAGETETVREAIREGLRKGQKGEYVSPERP
jgi:hypothetical protein